MSKLKNIKYFFVARALLTSIVVRNGCWFIENRDWSEYTTFMNEIAHRLSYGLFVGQIVKSILHNCDYKGCVNYEHLFQGSQSINSRDYRRKRQQSKLAQLTIHDTNRNWRDDAKTIQFLIDKRLIEDDFLKVRQQ